MDQPTEVIDVTATEPDIFADAENHYKVVRSFKDDEGYLLREISVELVDGTEYSTIVRDPSIKTAAEFDELCKRTAQQVRVNKAAKQDF